jgi:hypothetical protein
MTAKYHSKNQNATRKPKGNLFSGRRKQKKVYRALYFYCKKKEILV